VSMYIITDHQTGRQTTVGSLGAAYDWMRRAPNATVCDLDGVICATTRQGLFRPCDAHGFPVKIARDPSTTKP